MLYNAKDLAELAQEYDIGDPIDWGMLNVQEDDAYLMIAEQVVAIMRRSDNPELVATIAMTKLLVENFVLNLRLAGFEEPDYT
jgi:hypothetical protein